ncbi:MAG: hypothetical protein LUP95_06820, partial [Euryarchaeota archaeon]|nr:hypothetical protein [Euryarchaeota archaeon]
MPILQVSPQISQNTGILIAIGLAVLVIIIAIALVIRARRRRPEKEAGQPPAMQAEETQRFDEESEQYKEISTPIPLAEESHPIYSEEPSVVYAEAGRSEHALEEPMDYSALEFPQKTTKIIKGNVNVAAVMASP